MKHMQPNLTPIISPSDFVLLQKTENIVLIDARVGANMKELYAANHLDSALFVDLEKQLADRKEDAANGGRHPLPTILHFSNVLTQLGITPEHHVVVYDDKNGANAAARFWWMLKSVGHVKIQVIDGGMQAAIAAGFPTNSKEETPLLVETYDVSDWLLPLADIETVEKVSEDDNFLVIDVRDAYRYRGESEPIDLIAGHIPGATNIPFSANLDAEGFFLPPDVLKEMYQKALAERDAEHVIVHCGSGITACHTLLAMDYAGLEIPKLYVGSWSEWSRTDRIIATEI
jgi:thiosulfate/3-mercaptopyruvate sulfurtransferase